MQIKKAYSLTRLCSVNLETRVLITLYSFFVCAYAFIVAGARVCFETVDAILAKLRNIFTVVEVFFY